MNLFRFPTRQSLQDRGGDRVRKQVCVFGVWFWRQQDVQKWSPLMHEIEESFGIRIGHVSLGVTSVKKHFFDGKQPAVVRGQY